MQGKRSGRFARATNTRLGAAGEYNTVNGQYIGVHAVNGHLEWMGQNFIFKRHLLGVD